MVQVRIEIVHGELDMMIARRVAIVEIARYPSCYTIWQTACQFLIILSRIIIVGILSV